MRFYKSECVSALQSMVDETLEIVKAHIDFIGKESMDHPSMPEVSRQLATHLQVLHWAFPMMRRLFSKTQLDEIISEELLSKIELIYIEGLKSGQVLACTCDYCVDHEQREQSKKVVKNVEKRMRVLYDK